MFHWHWIDVILSMLFKHCFVNAETTSIKTHLLSFHFQLNFNFKTTLVHQCCFNEFYRRCFNVFVTNVERASINVRQLSFQPNINVHVFAGAMVVFCRFSKEWTVSAFHCRSTQNTKWGLHKNCHLKIWKCSENR